MKQFPRTPILLNYLERKIDQVADWLSDLANDYRSDEEVRKSVNLTAAIALIFSLNSNDGLNSSYTPDDLTPIDFTVDTDETFKIINQDTACLPQDKGHQSLIELSEIFNELFVINHGNRKTLIFDKNSGNWGVLSLDDGELCHLFSGTNFNADDPQYVQDMIIGYGFGDDYLDRIKPARGNLITLGPLI